MLGSPSDAVQEACLRLSCAHTAVVQNLGGWLTTVVGRVCLVSGQIDGTDPTLRAGRRPQRSMLRPVRLAG
jgi:hypothetical protein